MSPIARKLVAGGLVLAVVAAAFFYVRGLRTELADAKDRLACSGQAVASRDTTINGLRHDAGEKATQQQQLDAATGKVAAKLAAARQDVRKVINENATVRTWADTPLPADVARLSASPALTGADDFGAAVPADHALHAVRDGAAH
ncbi:protein lysB [Burkholderia pyrrocinia]|nr:protein lysB [Burkholderia pyrrocinia]